MPITERTLKRWRKDALHDMDISIECKDAPITSKIADMRFKGHLNRILRMTQELLDQHLLREQKSTQTKRGE